MRTFQRHREKRQRQLKGVEYYLMEALVPVAPSKEFVNTLRDQLANLPIPTPIPPAKIGMYTFYALVFVVAGGLLAAILVRYILALIALLGLLRQSRSS